MEVLERLTPYVELVHLLLNTNFTYLTRKLAPSDSLDRARIPSAVAKSYDEVLFGGVLFDCVPGIPCEIKTPFGICFTALALWKGDGFVLIGPYLPERGGRARSWRRFWASQGVPLGLKEQYGVYYRDLPTLSRGKVARRTGRTGGGRVRREPCVQRFQQPGYLPGGPVPLSPYLRRIPCRCAQTPLHGGMRESAGLWKRWPAAICAPPTWVEETTLRPGAGAQ